MRDPIEAEQSVLGALLMQPSAIDIVSSEMRLRPEHFYGEKHAAIYGSMLELRDNDTAVDIVTLAGRLGDQIKPAVATAQAMVPVVAHFRDYAREVIAAAEWRRTKLAGQLLVAAAEAEDPEKRTDAERLLATEPVELADLTRTPEQLADEFWAHLEGGSEAFPFPFDRLNHLTGGGMRRGQVTLIGGWTSFGKSLLLDQALDHAQKRGLSVHLFINEMTRIERTARTIARKTGISNAKLMQGKLSFEETEAVTKALGSLPFGITNASDMSAEEISREIRRRRYDVVGIDILHLIEHEDEADMRRISRVINKATKAGKGCHVLATVHLNEHRAHRAQLPLPQLGDIRQSGMLKNDADNVLFVHREQTAEGNVKREGSVYLRKVRSGQQGGFKVRLDTDRMRFAPLAEA